MNAVLIMFLNFDKDSGMCSDKIGSYPVIKKLLDRHSNAPKQWYYIVKSYGYTKVKK